MDLISLHSTPHSGRTLLAMQFVPANTLLRTCSAPYAVVIYREFRKVVCALCFTHVSSSMTTPMKSKYTLCITELGVWFCSGGCMERWGREENVGGMLGRVWTAFGSAVKRMSKQGATTMRNEAGGEGRTAVTLKELDDAWNEAETRKVEREIVHLDDMELETARFIASAIVRRFIEDTIPPPLSPPSVSPPHLWLAFLHLQSNELAQYLRFPHLLSTHLRVFAFLRWVLPKELRRYVDKGETVRAVLAREVGNSFGIWEHEAWGVEGERGDMFGWGVYVSASYFNHSCAPNVRKEASGRGFMFYTAREVKAGEELCISYIGGECTQGLANRRQTLKENWFFECRCARCVAEEMS